MCVAIIKPANFSFSEADIHAFYDANPDGFGAAWRAGRQIKTFKSLPRSEAAAWADYSTLNIHNKEVVLHWRWATHGPKTLANTHPFPVLPGLVMVHNGVLSEHALGLDCKGGITDTVAYVRKYIVPLIKTSKKPLELVRTPEFLDLIGSHIGGSKFIFLDKFGNLSTVNAALGKHITRSGTRIWVSNTNWDRPAWTDDWRTVKPMKDTWSNKALPKPKATTKTEVEGANGFYRAVDSVFASFGEQSATYFADADLLDFYLDLGENAAWDALEELEGGETSVDEFANYVLGIGAGTRVEDDTLTLEEEDYIYDGFVADDLAALHPMQMEVGR